MHTTDKSDKCTSLSCTNTMSFFQAGHTVECQLFKKTDKMN